MNENVIEFLRNADMATASFSQGKYISKIRKLAERFPDECEIVAENPDGSIVAHFPVKWIKINKVTRAGREYTEEEKRIFAERLHEAKRNRSKKGEKDLEDN